MSCPNPIDAAVLADYWLGVLAGREEEAVEEHLHRLRPMRRTASGSGRACRGSPETGARRTVTAEDDILIGRLAANLSGAKRVDLCICNDRGIEQIRLTDIPFNSAAGSIAFQQPITYAKAAPSEILIARRVAFDDSGREHLLGEYTFNHTRTLPGPGAW